MFRAFITQLDKQALRAIGVTIAMFALVVSMILFGRAYLGIDETTLQSWFGALSGSYWALPATIVLFVLAAFVGVPQWGLIAAAVIAFGPAQGAVYSWIATMVSASVDFSIGRAIGAERVRKFGGNLVNRMIALVRRNGFVTSFTVRLVPTGPFVLVNMAAGVSRMTVRAFLGGTALGIIPKIAAVAFLGQSFFAAIKGTGPVSVLGSLALLGIIIGVMLYARRRLKSREDLSSIRSESTDL